MIRQGLRTQMWGWQVLEQAVSGTPLNELPHLLCQMQDELTPSASVTVKEEGEGEAEAQGSQATEARPITLVAEGKYTYACSLCPEYVKVTKNAIKAHIAKIHAKTALLCSCCAFSCYNPDQLKAHYREKH